MARRVILSSEERQILESRVSSPHATVKSVKRAQIVLRAAAGLQDLQIAAELRITPETAARWRKRFLEGGLPALDRDAPRPGRTPSITLAKVNDIIRRTTQEKPGNAPSWSARKMAEITGISEKSVRRIWHRHGLKPHVIPMHETDNHPRSG